MKEFMGIKIESEMVEAIKKQAKQEERSMSSLIRMAIKKYLESVNK